MFVDRGSVETCADRRVWGDLGIKKGLRKLCYKGGSEETLVLRRV